MIRFLRFTFLLSFVALTSGVAAQIDGGQADRFPDFSVMMQQPDANFFTIRDQMEDYWFGRPVTKGSGFKPYKRWEAYWELRVDAAGNFPPAESVFNEHAGFLSSVSAFSESVNGNWTELGPVSLPNNGTSQPNGLGRLNAVAFHPANSSIIWVGSPSGGLWKTTNGGISWSSNTDTLPTLGVSAILIHPTNPNTMYLGTGDRDAGDAPGLGVFKSTDGGASWTFSNSGMGNKVVGRMVMSPSNSNHMLAATSGGIYKSTDGGNTWVLTSGNTSYYKDIALKPGSSTVVYATAMGDFYRSTDFGSNWTMVTSGLPTFSDRLVIGVSNANSNYVYCLFAASDNRSFGGLFRSVDSGLSFSLMSDSPNIMGYSTDGSTTGGQAWYDICIAVDPLNANVIYAGGINIWKSVNGGSAWTLNAHWVGSGGVPAVHADIHDLVFSPVNGKLYAGCDGGIYETANGGSTWTDISSGLAIAQVYKIGQSATIKNLVINGYQDNGTAIYSNGTWTTEIGGDGMECIIDPTNANYLYGALYYGDVRRSSNGGLNFSAIAADGVNGINESGAWVTPYMLDVNNANTMYIGYNNLWRSTNVKTSNANSVTWTKISNFTPATNTIRVLEQSIANSDILYVARFGPAFYRTDNLSNSAPTWTDLSASLPNTTLPTDIAAHPGNANVVFMTQSNKVYMSINKGLTWSNISANLPNVSMNCLVIDTVLGGSKIYVGSDLGVYYRDLSGTSWTFYGLGLPAAAEVTELEIFYHPLDHMQSVIRASTYGRGLWSSALSVNLNLAPIAYFESSDSIICTNQAVSLVDMSLFGPNSWQWSITPSTFTFQSGSASSQNPTVVFTQPGQYSVSLTVLNTNGSSSFTRTNFIRVGGLPLPFTENFESQSTRDLWQVRNPDASNTWTNYTVSGNSPGSTAMGIDFFTYGTVGQRDSLISPLLNFSPFDSVVLNFQHAYALYSTGYIDSFFVSISTGCGNQWTRILTRADNGSGNFATSMPTTSPFTPAVSTDWCGSGYGAACLTLDLTPWAGQEGVRLAFHTYNGYSNNLYIDNISLQGFISVLSSGFSISSPDACPGDTVFLTNNSFNATGYKWLADGVQFSTIASPAFIVPASIASPTSILIQLVAYDASNNSDTSSFLLQVGVAPGMPAAPVGPPFVCNGGNGASFAVTPVPGALSYQWNVLPAGSATVSGQGSAVNAVFDPQYVGQASISVSAVNSCGSGPASAVVTFQVGEKPDDVVQPAGPSFLCQNPGSTTHWVSAANGAFAYQWLISPGWAASISGNDTVVTVNWDSTFTGQAIILALAVNPCGVSLGTPDTVIVGKEPEAPNTPGGPTQACQNSDSTVVFALPVQFATSYDFDLTPPSAGVITPNVNEAYINWNNSFSGQVQIRARSVNNCGTSNWSANKTITVRSAPSVPVITQSNDTLYSSEFYGNMWYNMNGPTNWTDYFFVPPAGGWYYVVVTNGYGCSERSANFWYSPVGVDENLSSEPLKVFPNPTSGLIMIESSVQFEDFMILDVLGNAVRMGDYKEGEPISLEDLAVGVYYLVLRTSDGTLQKGTRVIRY